LISESFKNVDIRFARELGREFGQNRAAEARSASGAPANAIPGSVTDRVPGNVPGGPQ